MKIKTFWLHALTLLLIALFGCATAGEAARSANPASNAAYTELSEILEESEASDILEDLETAGVIEVLESMTEEDEAADTSEAPDLTQECAFTLCSTHRRADLMTDGSYISYWESGKMQHPWFIVSSPKPMYGLYLCFRQMPDEYELQVRRVVSRTRDEEGNVKETTEWVTLMPGDTRFQHVFYDLSGETEIRVYVPQEGHHNMGLFEMHVFGRGEIPAWVQRWEPTEEKADILFFSAHPDDELLFYGGAIPTYAGELKKRVIVAYLSYGNAARRTEALNGLWTAGVRHYPVFGGFRDSYSTSAKAAYETLGKTKVLAWVVEMYRKYQPEVVVSHDLNGEYGHGQHRMMADAAVQAWDLAADAAHYTDSAELYGTWQVKKLYLHLYGDESSQIVFDWSVPLEFFGGKTGLEVAAEAYAMHVTQENAKVKINRKWTLLSVEETGAAFPNTTFGLYATRVGPDETRSDFLEHIE